MLIRGVLVGSTLLIFLVFSFVFLFVLVPCLVPNVTYVSVSSILYFSFGFHSNLFLIMLLLLHESYLNNPLSTQT
jgi:hypothetical protein